MPATALRLAITGGIGSGKSTVGQLFVKLGASLIDADALSHELTAASGAAMAPITARFGSSVQTQDGALDRAAMRALIYEDQQARRALEEIIHPLVAQLAGERGRRAEQTGSRCIVYDIPLLAESSAWRQRVDRVLVIDCASDTQIARVMQRSRLDQAEVEAIIAVQATRLKRLHCADWVIDNSGASLAQLAEEVRHIAKHFGL
jgi:dephospho-CoA kinase